MAQFVKTQLVSSIGQFVGTHVGQWVQLETGARGQYLGTTPAGATVIRWQVQGKFRRNDALNNKHLRAFARLSGALR